MATPTPTIASNSTSSEERTVHVALRRAVLGPSRQLPLKSSPLAKDNTLDHPLQQQIKDEVLRILKEHHIDDPDPSASSVSRGSDAIEGAETDPRDEKTIEETHKSQYPCVSLVNRYSIDDFSDQRPTVLIEADWHEPASATKWPEAILHIQSALKHIGEPIIAELDFDIELIASPQTREIELDLKLYGGFNKFWRTHLDRKISQILRKSPEIGDFLVAWGPDPVRNISHLSPWPLAFGIWVRPECKEENWPPVVDAVKTYLQQAIPDIDIDVSFIHGEAWSGLFD